VGNYVWSHKVKEEVLHGHFQQRLGTCEHWTMTIQWSELELPSLSAQSLDQPFMEAEIRTAIKELPAEKSPGPDGFNGVFFKACWGVIKHDIVATF
jgi:hypothetical protein